MIKLNNTTNYLVISLTTGGKEAINTVLNKEFGVKFIDARQYLIDYGLDDAGLTPTQEDLDNISNNLVPKSLLVDSDNVQIQINGTTIYVIAPILKIEDRGIWENYHVLRYTFEFRDAETDAPYCLLQSVELCS